MKDNWEYMAGSNKKVVKRQRWVNGPIEYYTLKVCDCCGFQEYLWSNMIVCGDEQ